MLDNNKIPQTKEHLNSTIAEIVDERFHGSCRNLKTLKLVLQDMYLYTTDLYIYSTRMLEVLMDEDYSLEKKILIQDKFNHIIQMLDGYRMQYKSRCSNLD